MPQLANRQVTFHTRQSNVQIYQVDLEPIYLGVSNNPVIVRVPIARDVSMRFQLKLAGYQTRDITVPSSDLRPDDTHDIADDGGAPFELLPASVGVLVRDELRDHLAVLLGVGTVSGLVLGLVVMPLWRKTKRTARLAASYQSLSGTGPREPTGDSMIGAIMGRWVLTEKLGKGGMATVYRGIPQETMDPRDAVAIKVINPDRLENPESRARFEREVRIGARLSHPNIVRLIDWGTSGPFFLVMELVEGYPLRRLVRADGMSPTEALHLLRPVFEAMMYAHDQGVWHRDLKPENIFVNNRDGRLTVMDFGISRQASDATVTATDQMPVTPGYMSPEQFSAKGVAAASDQYSLGIIVWELVVGARPFDDESPLVLVLKHVSAPLPNLRDFKPEVPPAFEAALARMLAKAPAERYPDLRHAWVALTASVTPDGVVERW